MIKTKMWCDGYNFIVLYCFILFKLSISGEVGDKCAPTEELINGTCTLLTKCEDALRLVRTTDFHPYSRCGFSGITEIVCCPHPPRVADRECQKIMNTTLPSLSYHIIGGTNAALAEFPHMVILGYNKTGEYEFLCGGSLISESFVLTAAHCIDVLRGLVPAIARMGVLDIGDGRFNSASDVRIQQSVVHPEHTRSLKYNDIALLKLERPVRFSPWLSPICLYTKDEDPSINLIVSGWGRTNVSRNIRSSILQKAPVVVVSLEQCRKAHPAFWRLPDGITNHQMCAGDPKGHHDACQGDSGGPLQGLTHDDGFLRLVAVTSYGRGCAVPDVPGVYTRVSSYLDWIESVVWPSRN